MKRIWLSITLWVIASAAVFAQDATPSTTTTSFWSDPLKDPLMPIYVVGAFTLIVIVLILIVAAYLLRILNMMMQKTAEEKAAKAGVPFVPPSSAWSRFWENLNAAVPVEQEKTIELDHNFDGIKELDNHLPPWWTALFYGAIIWGAIYMFVYHVSDSLPLQIEEYQTDVAEADAAKRKFLAKQPKTQIDENALTYTADKTFIENGKKIYLSSCSPCHKNNGEGSIGPNLTDDYWIHGGDIKSIYSTIKNGVVEKGMIAWSSTLKPDEIRDVSYFVMSIHGTNPPGAKAPQGELYKPEQPTAPADTTKTTAALN
jgi:cytochrome c oxidase cbb3-type subunit III